MSELENYKQLITSIPVDGHTVFINLDDTKVWGERGVCGSLIKQELKQLLNDENIIVKDKNGNNTKKLKISRKNIKDSSEKNEQDRRIKILKILMWGYPKGNHNHMVSIINKLSDIEKTLATCRNRDLNNDKGQLFNRLKSIQSLGISTWSKFLYFFNVKIESSECLIYDDKVRESLNSFHQITELSQRTNWYRTTRNYLEYLQLMHNLSNKIQSSPDQLELFLFYFNRNYQL